MTRRRRELPEPTGPRVAMERANPFGIDSEPLRALITFDGSTHGRPLEAPLLTLIKLKVSLVIGSEFCIARYFHKALCDGECKVRLADLIEGQPLVRFSEREQNALAWAATVARAAETHIPDAAYIAASVEFSPDELVALTAAVAAATAWNQIGLSFRVAPTQVSARTRSGPD